jgi:hypothetical protein
MMHITLTFNEDVSAASLFLPSVGLILSNKLALLVALFPVVILCSLVALSGTWEHSILSSYDIHAAVPVNPQLSFAIVNQAITGNLSVRTFYPLLRNFQVSTPSPALHSSYMTGGRLTRFVRQFDGQYDPGPQRINLGPACLSLRRCMHPGHVLRVLSAPATLLSTRMRLCSKLYG